MELAVVLQRGAWQGRRGGEGEVRWGQGKERGRGRSGGEGEGGDEHRKMARLSRVTS